METNSETGKRKAEKATQISHHFLFRSMNRKQNKQLKIFSETYLREKAYIFEEHSPYVLDSTQRGIFLGGFGLVFGCCS